MGKKVWSLSAIPEEYQALIEQKKLNVTSLPMFEPYLYDSLSKAKEFLQLLDKVNPDVLVLTSKNSADVLGSWLKTGVILESDLPDLAAIGVKTMMELSDFVSQNIIYPNQSNAESLAEELIKSNPKNIIHLCGDKSRKELSEKLTAAGIEYHSLVVYETRKVSFDKSIFRETPPDVIWALSPSSVERFYKESKGYFNSVIYLTIGLTTYDTARNLGLKNIFVASEPSFETMIEDTDQIV
jgi:uroporphyrinogen-III synthase